MDGLCCFFFCNGPVITHDPDNPFIENGAVQIEGDTIVAVGPDSELRGAGGDYVDVQGRVILPGLINAHTHLQYTNMAEVGRGTYDRFRAWELGFNEVYEKLQETRPWKESAYEGARMMVEAGTTAAADIVTDPEAVGALASQGMHGIAYWEVMGWHNDDWKTEGIAELISNLGHMHQEGLPSIGISPHAPYTLETEPFVDLPDIARQLDMRLHIHLSETPIEAGDHESMLTTYSAADWRGDDLPRHLRRRGA